jgi:HSP20 family molecular chaperone IbpA
MQSKKRYPVYNIEKIDDDFYRIVKALSGFLVLDMNVEVWKILDLCGQES